MADNLEKFQELLREIFQFDCSDLDFGIYRIMNYKREAVARFIETELPASIDRELSTGALASQSHLAAELEETADEIRETLGDAALNGEGALAEQFHATPLGKRYSDLQKRAFGTVARPALEAAIFNHLYAFFSRYYDTGDFLSKRRYSRKEKYAIPYNGEEVYLHWANSDQYYIKTGEYFTDYRFKAPNGVTVHFHLRQADVPQNNVKGDKRFFIPLAEKARYDRAAREVTIPFEFRPLNDREQAKYGQRNQQDTILAEALEALPTHFTEGMAVAGLIANHHHGSDGAEVSFLAHHLRRYTQKNTADFFIHKDLKGFLSRELDFYIKNEVLHLDEMEAAGELRADGWFQIMRVMRAVGGRIIDFLAQIENFQKMLFEKRKFIVETQYCITVGNIDETFYAEIAASDAQWAQWKELFHIDEEQTDLFTNGKNKKDRRVAFLKAHPTLVLDTRCFEADFTDRLLGSFGDLDEMTDGLLIQSENFQALSLLLHKYRRRIQCVYIDPPFNSPSTEILYKNDYKHSTWLTLLENRLSLSRDLLADGVYVIAIDENEQERLGLLLEGSWLGAFKKVCVAIRHNPRGIQGTNFSHCHEYAYFLYPSDEQKYIGDRKLNEPDVRNLRDSGLESDRTDARNCFYPIIARDDEIVKIGDVPSDGYHPAGVNETNPDGTVSVWPIDTHGNEKKWRYARQSVEQILPKLEVRTTRGKYEIYFAKDVGTVRTLWADASFDASEYGTKLLQAMLGSRTVDFSYPKSIYTVIETIRVSCASNRTCYVLDYFAGSGTSGHAVIALNREDGGTRKFIMAEMGGYVDTVLLPRIKKVTFAPEWKDGKPAREPTAEEAERSPRIVKVIRLESYEDALGNIAFTDAPKTLYDFDDYVLRYMLEWETKESPTLLNISQLANPFSYRLRIQGSDGVTNGDEKVVDIPETFVYLLGMHVTTRQDYCDKERRYLVYRGRIDHRQVALIWRDVAGWEKADYERDKKFVADQKLAEGADEVFVNGDSLIPGARSLDGVFKSRMFGGV